MESAFDVERPAPFYFRDMYKCGDGNVEKDDLESGVHERNGSCAIGDEGSY